MSIILGVLVVSRFPCVCLLERPCRSLLIMAKGSLLREAIFTGERESQTGSGERESQTGYGFVTFPKFAKSSPAKVKWSLSEINHTDVHVHRACNAH